MNRSKHWYEYLWIVTPVYLLLGFFNILFAWLGMIFFCVPLIIAIATGNKTYCNRYCDRGQFLTLLGGRLRLSRNRPTPNWMRSRWFRYGFLVFFLVMFLQMLWVTYLVGAGAQSLGQSVKLFWTFRVPWHWAYHGTLLAPWVAQFAFGFYSMMLTSNLIGWIVMALYKPRTWCVFCPMGTMTQLICRLRAGKPTEEGEKIHGGEAKQVAELLKLLANENRLLLLCALLERPMTVGELGEHTPTSASALSQHLHALRSAGLVADQRRGQYVVYSVADERVRVLLAVLREQYCREE